MAICVTLPVMTVELRTTCKQYVTCAKLRIVCMFTHIAGLTGTKEELS